MSAQRMTLQMLQERFVSGLERRLVHLVTCVATLNAGPAEADAHSALDELMRGFHSLAGIGGTYGFHDISEIARTGELLCREMQTPPSRETMMTISDVITQLSRAAAHAGRGGVSLSAVIAPGRGLQSVQSANA